MSPSCVERALCGTRRRLHDRRHREVFEERGGSNGRVVSHHDEGNPWPDSKDTDMLVILNRILMVEEGVLTCEPDPKHVKLLCEGMWLREKSKGLEVASSQGRTKERGRERRLDGATRFRALAARANDVALDRVDFQFVAKEACREMSAPKQSSWGAAQEAGRLWPTLATTYFGQTYFGHDLLWPRPTLATTYFGQ